MSTGPYSDLLSHTNCKHIDVQTSRLSLTVITALGHLVFFWLLLEGDLTPGSQF